MILHANNEIERAGESKIGRDKKILLLEAVYEIACLPAI